MFLHATFHAAINVGNALVFVFIKTFEHEEILIVRDDLRVDRVKRTFAERKVIDGIKKVGLSFAIMPYQAVHFGRQLQCGLAYVFEIQY